MLDNYINKIPPFFRNKYAIVAIAYLIYMMFIDSNDYRSQFKLRQNLRSLEKQEKYYTKQIEIAKLKYDNLFNDPKSLEKFAREKYWMKRADEDLYIILDK
jgi:cell division protein FtsB